jgi:hypothetical protein
MRRGREKEERDWLFVVFVEVGAGAGGTGTVAVTITLYVTTCDILFGFILNHTNTCPERPLAARSGSKARSWSIKQVQLFPILSSFYTLSSS